MTGGHGTDRVEDRSDSELEELLAQMLDVPGTEPDANGADTITRVLTSAAVAALSRISQTSSAGRALLVEALSPALADALAPALARTLAPEIVKAFNQIAAGAEPTATDSDDADEGSPDEAATTIANGSRPEYPHDSEVISAG